jgi:hypothetical protein
MTLGGRVKECLRKLILTPNLNNINLIFSLLTLVVPQHLKNKARKRITWKCAKFKRCPVQYKPSFL